MSWVGAAWGKVGGAAKGAGDAIGAAGSAAGKGVVAAGKGFGGAIATNGSYFVKSWAGGLGKVGHALAPAVAPVAKAGWWAASPMVHAYQQLAGMGVKAALPVVGKGVVAGVKGLGSGLMAAGGLGLKALAIGGAAGLAALTLMRKKPSALKAMRWVGGHFNSRTGKHEAPRAIIESDDSHDGFPWMKVVILLLLVAWLMPAALPGAWARAKGDGAKYGLIQPSAYACATSIPIEPMPQGGGAGIAAEIGHRMFQLDHAKGWSAGDVKSFLVKESISLGKFAGRTRKTFIESLNGLPPATGTTVAGAHQFGINPTAYNNCCPVGATGTPPGGIPTAYTPAPPVTGTDTPAMVAVKALIAAGFPNNSKALLDMTARAGAESGWNPLAQNSSSSAKGLLQIMMSLHASLFKPGELWSDPFANARVGKILYDQSAASGRDPEAPWFADNATYPSYMTRAQQAINAVNGVLGPVPETPEPPAPIVPVSSCSAAGGGTVPTGYTPGSSQASVATQYAVAQEGKPYVWGGVGPAGYDCSGLVMMGYRAAGISLPRTTTEMWKIGTVVQPADLQIGDLIFSEFGENFAAVPGHVGLYLGGGKYVNAPHTGDVVRESDLPSGYVAKRVGPGKTA